VAGSHSADYPEASAAVVFGLWFLTCLVLTVRAIRRDGILHHQLFEVTRLGSFESSFGPAFLSGVAAAQ
jgi:hypothetical protein